jgi:CRISPR-associated protein Cas1
VLNHPSRGVVTDNWRIIDLTSFSGRLRYQRGRLLLCPHDGEESEVGLADVAIMLIGLGVDIGAGVLHQLAAFDTVALVCDWKGVPAAGAYAWSQHTRVGARQNAQFTMTLPRRKNAWAKIIRAKIAGQAANLRCLGHEEWRGLVRLVDEVRSGDPANVEGQAARYYWSRLFQEDGFSRIPQDGSGHNAMLDYGYAVLRGYGIRAVLSAGLCATIGLFHCNRSNAFNLVEDLIEPFRPAVDWVVASISPEASVGDKVIKRQLVGASTQPFTSDGLSVAAALNDLAQRYGRYSEGQLDNLKVPAWTGPQAVAIDEDEL